MNEFSLIHRRIKDDGTKTEQLISLVPTEDLSNLIDRINPKANDEIVIKVVDKTVEANTEAIRRIDSMHSVFNRPIINTPPEDDLPF